MPRCWKSVLLRSQSLAVYATENMGHFGLALEAYGALHLADPPLSRPAAASRDQACADQGQRRRLPLFAASRWRRCALQCSESERRADEAAARSRRALSQRVDGAARRRRVRRRDQRRHQLRPVRRARRFQGQRPGARDAVAARLLPFRSDAQDAARASARAARSAWATRSGVLVLQGQRRGPAHRLRGAWCVPPPPKGSRRQKAKKKALGRNDRMRATTAKCRMSKNQWIAGINAVAAALEHDADNVREVLIEAGGKNPRLTEIEETARRARDIDVRRVAHAGARRRGRRLAPPGRGRALRGAEAGRGERAARPDRSGGRQARWCWCWTACRTRTTSAPACAAPRPPA